MDLYENLLQLRAKYAYTQKLDEEENVVQRGMKMMGKYIVKTRDTQLLELYSLWIN